MIIIIILLKQLLNPEGLILANIFLLVSDSNFDRNTNYRVLYSTISYILYAKKWTWIQTTYHMQISTQNVSWI